VNQYEAEPFPGEHLLPPLSTEVLLDRYHSHTLKCASCYKALTNIRKIRWGMGIIGAIAWAMLPIVTLTVGKSSILSAIVSGIILLAAGGVWIWLGKLERQFYEGQEVPSRNIPGKK
jgi:hypothetical protein